MRASAAFGSVLALLALTGTARSAIRVQPWGNYAGQNVSLYTLSNKNGMEARIANYGGIITSLKVPDRNGVFADVVEGFDGLADYTSPDYLRMKPHYGALLGRFADRIKNETYVLDGVTYHRTRDGKPYDERVWNATTRGGAEPQLILELVDPDGDSGFPGRLRVVVTYTLTNDNVLRVDYRATTDKKTIANLTNHSYFNLAGGGTVLGHLLTVNADAFTPGDGANAPTGEVRPVAGTPFDFRTPTPIGLHIDAPDPLLKQVHGYGLNFRLKGTPGTMRLGARLEDPKSGRVMEEWTTQPDIRLYSANNRPPPVALAKGYILRGAVALEAEHAANSPNIPSFVSSEVTPERPLHEVVEFRFLTSPGALHALRNSSALTRRPAR
jgi:aldose 1-epimerase